LTTPATPEEPRAPTPVFQLTLVLTPTSLLKAGLTEERYSVKL
jgi:hypothetical protein